MSWFKKLFSGGTQVYFPDYWSSTKFKDDWNREFNRRARPVFRRYLREIVEKTAFQGKRKAGRQEIDELVRVIEDLIVPFGWSNQDDGSVAFQFSYGTDLEIAKRLQPYVDQLSSYPLMPYVLIGYESITRGGITEDLVFHLNLIVAHVVYQHAPASYEVVTGMFQGLDPTTLAYARKLEGYQNPDRVLIRQRLDIIGALYYLAMPSGDLWPNKRPEVCSWARTYLESIYQWASRIDPSSSLSYWSGQYLSNLKRQS